MRTAAQVWRLPLLLAVVTAIGLVLALIEDGWADTTSWIALAIPVAVVVRCITAVRGKRPGQRT